MKAYPRSHLSNSALLFPISSNTTANRARGWRSCSPHLGEIERRKAHVPLGLLLPVRVLHQEAQVVRPGGLQANARGEKGGSIPCDSACDRRRPAASVGGAVVVPLPELRDRRGAADSRGVQEQVRGRTSSGGAVPTAGLADSDRGPAKSSTAPAAAAAGSGFPSGYRNAIVPGDSCRAATHGSQRARHRGCEPCQRETTARCGQEVPVPLRPGTSRRDRPVAFTCRSRSARTSITWFSEPGSCSAIRIPSGDLAQIMEHVFRTAIAQYEQRRFGATESRRSSGGTSSNPRYIPAEMRRAVRARDGDQCTFVSASGTAARNASSCSSIMSSRWLRADGQRSQICGYGARPTISTRQTGPSERAS